jgi:hypothetical protein
MPLALRAKRCIAQRVVPLNLKKALLVPLAVLLVVPSIPPASAVVTYDQGVWFNWSKTTIDVLISDVHVTTIAWAIERAIQMWENGIAYWNSTLASSLNLRVWWPDSGLPMPPGFLPDIVFVPQGFMSVHAGADGGELQPTCYATAPMLVLYGTFLRVTSHEFGHCLGLEHVFTNGVEYEPGFDIMGGGDGNKCPSNLNVRVLERVFNGGTGVVHMSSTTYAQAPTC